VPAASGAPSLTLPAGMRHQYSSAYGRFDYVVLDASGQVLFASSPEWTPLVGDLPDAETIQFFQAKRDDRIISGVTL
ncbi:hypothetical protein ABTE06_23410, partial [Acinetobacter baumannii]